MMKNSTLMSFFIIFSTLTLHVSSDSQASLQDKCSPAFTKLGECLGYASAKTDTPSSACCSSVGDIRAKDPVCLCFIIQQAHAGGSTVTSMGLQIDRLTSLPSACKLANVNISDCPKLLKLTPSSPDYAIFTNSTKASSTPATPSGSSSTPSSNDSSSGMVNEISIAAIFLATVISAALFQVEAQMNIFFV